MGVPDIAPLADAREAAIVAEWIWAEWAQHEPGVRREASDAVVLDALHGDPLPHFVVARVDGTPVGCASILAADLPTRPDLGPWLANVYVRPEHRRSGLGTRLVERATAYGTGLAERLYLYTFESNAFYERLGWRLCGTGEYTGRAIAILRYERDASMPEGTRR